MGIKRFFGRLFYGKAYDEWDERMERLADGLISGKVGKEELADEIMRDVIEDQPSYMKEDMRRIFEKRMREKREAKEKENRHEAGHSKQDKDRTDSREDRLTLSAYKDHAERVKRGEPIENVLEKMKTIGKEELEKEIKNLMEGGDEEFFLEIGDLTLNRPSLTEIDKIVKRYISGLRMGEVTISRDYLRLRTICKAHYNDNLYALMTDFNSLPENRQRNKPQEIFRERYGGDPEARYVLKELFGAPCDSDDIPSSGLEQAAKKLKFFYFAYLGSDKEIQLNAIMLFFMGYFELKRIFPDFENVHRGYLSSVTVDDIDDPATNKFKMRRRGSEREVQSKIAGEEYDFFHHVAALNKIMARDGTGVVQRIDRFAQPYDPVEHGLKDMEAVLADVFDSKGKSCLPRGYNRSELQNVFKNSGISIEVRKRLKGVIEQGVNQEDAQPVANTIRQGMENALKELSTKTTKSGGKIEHLVLHDCLLPIYLRLGYPPIESLRTGRTLSTFLKLDPEMKTGRCTAGRGGYRHISYQYGLDPDIQIADLCFDSPQNCVAEAVLVSAVNEWENRSRITVVETVEAGLDAYVLPNYNGRPAWTYLLLEEIFRRSCGGGNPRILFSTGIDEKPAINHFYRAVAEFLELEADLPDAKKYDVGTEVGREDFLTTSRWRGKSNSPALKLEKANLGEKLKQKYLEELADQYKTSPTLQSMISIDDFLKSGEMFLRRAEHLFAETYLGAWGIDDNMEVATDGSRRPKPPFNCREQININNGCGLVRGFVYDINKEKYDAFNEKMKAVKRHIGLKVQPT